MATAKQCDRCGKLFKTYKTCPISKNNYELLLRYETDEIDDYRAKIYDLCPDCMSKFEDFLNNKEED